MSIQFECRDMTDSEFQREKSAFDEQGVEFGNPPEKQERFLKTIIHLVMAELDLSKNCLLRHSQNSQKLEYRFDRTFSGEAENQPPSSLRQGYYCLWRDFTFSSLLRGQTVPHYTTI